MLEFIYLCLLVFSASYIFCVVMDLTKCFIYLFMENRAWDKIFYQIDSDFYIDYILVDYAIALSEKRIKIAKWYII